MKRCIDCGVNKGPEWFYRVHKGSERRQSRCKPCDNRKRAGRKAGASDVEVIAVRRPDGSIDLVRRPRVARRGS